MDNPTSDSAALVLDSVYRHYRSGGTRLDVLQGASLVLQPGEMVGLVAPSGAGKSTLLHIAGLLEHPQAGQVRVAGRDCTVLNEAERTRVRRSHIGFVYQFHHLLPEFSALDNVAMPMLIAGAGQKDARERATELLSQMGLGERVTHQPAELSGGEQQRVAVARALANAPRVLIADEPTGNLDPATSLAVFGSLLEATRKNGVAALVATHNLELIRFMDRVFTLGGGKLVRRD